MMYHPSPFRSSPSSILESLLLFQLLLFHRERSLFLQKDLGTFFQSFAGTKSEGIEVSSCMSHALKISFTRRDARRRENKNACPGPGALNRWLRFTKERTNPRFATAKGGDLSAISRMHRWIRGRGGSDFDY